MLIMAIETSCDETAVAILEDGRKIRSNIVYSQVAIHRPYGGVVPELASRRHVEVILPTVEEALKTAKVKLHQIDVFAVTQGPGLVGSLLVGICVAKAFSYSLNKPLVAVNHLEGHLMAIFLEKEIDFPFIGMVISGGHTNLYLVEDFLKFKGLGQTLDDAAGEAFDKVARLLNLPYPGGISIEALAKKGNANAISFPRPMLTKGEYNVSFSGLKTAVATYLKRHPEALIQDVAASFQEAIVDVLTQKAIQAALDLNVSRLVIAGGVAANKRLRHKMKMAADAHSLKIYFPRPELCTDNAAMIAVAGYNHFKNRDVASLDLDAFSRTLSHDYLTS